MSVCPAVLLSDSVCCVSVSICVDMCAVILVLYIRVYIQYIYIYQHEPGYQP